MSSWKTASLPCVRLIRGVREVGWTIYVSFIMVRRGSCVPCHTNIRVALFGILRAVVVHSANFDVGTSLVCRSGFCSTIFVLYGGFVFVI